MRRIKAPLQLPPEHAHGPVTSTLLLNNSLYYKENKDLGATISEWIKAHTNDTICEGPLFQNHLHSMQ